MVQNPYINEEKYEYIYSIATLHMLVKAEDRIQFLKNIKRMLKPGGKLLLVNKGNGETDFSTDIERAFEKEERQHYQTGENIEVAATSYHSLKWEEHIKEIESVGFKVNRFINTYNDIYQNCMTVYIEI